MADDFSRPTNLSRPINLSFDKYLSLLTEANTVMNLTAVRDPEEIRIRHFEDSISLLNVVNFNDKDVIDIGSGAGFPGLALKLAEPGIRLTLLEATGKKVNFLKDTAAALGLTDINCIHGRAEELGHDPAFRESFDIATARGVAALPVLAELCMPFVRVGGCFLAMKESAAETADIERLGGRIEPPYTYTLSNGLQHSVIIVRKIAPTPSIYPRAWAQIKKKPLI